MPRDRPTPHKNDLSEKPQAERFTEAARQLECDEDKERFEEKLKQIAGRKPSQGSQAGSGGRSASGSNGGKPRRTRNRPGKE